MCFVRRCLTGKKIASVCDAVNAMKVVHDKGPHTVIITSTELGDTDNLLMIASHRKGLKTDSSVWATLSQKAHYLNIK